jgi:hypothetical protein
VSRILGMGLGLMRELLSRREKCFAPWGLSCISIS